ncbi:flagellar hook-basal body complex protein FliE [Nocardioides sp.]|uniref:flagellar hook-basal body complex protein FliE n=1 Tax=Nocardioides sp. TaxID=35761 RepID=UPI002B276F29|nr:flagellar hook-basal body complex protein FliE [Nocardioides sp.]
MSINGIESLGSFGAAGATGFTPLAPPQASPASGRTAGAGAASGSFGDLVLDGLDRLDGVQQSADKLAVQAATGELQNIHDYTIAATQAQVSTQVTVALRNKAVEAFSEIMRMQVG